MANERDHARSPAVHFTPERVAREDAIHDRYHRRPSPRELLESGEIDQESYERVRRLRDEGPPERPLRDLIAALKAERERQGLSLADVSERSGMDRAAIHKLEIGLNQNPTFATLVRYANALGKRIECDLVDK